MNTHHLQRDLMALLHRHQTSGLYVGDRIPLQKLHNAVAYFPVHAQEDILGLIDCTIFGSCKVGLAITGKGFIWKNDWTTDSRKTSLSWAELISCQNTIRAVNSDVSFAPGIQFGMSGSSMQAAGFIQLCLAIIALLSAQATALETPEPDMEEDRQDYLRGTCALVRLLAKFVKSDGPVTQNEIAFLEALFDDFSDQRSAEKRLFIEVFNQSKDHPASFPELAAELVAHTHGAGSQESQSFLDSLYGMFWQLALVNGELSDIKHGILQALPVLFGLPASAYGQAVAAFLAEDMDDADHESHAQETHSAADLQADYFALLGCEPDCSDEVLRIAYRRKMSALHPDKLQSKELADELLQFAHQQVQKINHAYAEIMKYRNR